MVLLNDVLEQLIKITRRQQHRAKEANKHLTMSSLDWVKDMCVIRLAAARGTGHTYTCYSIVEQFKASGKHAIATAPRAKHFGPLSQLVGKVHCPEAVLDEPKMYDLIAVDVASAMSLERLADLYSRLSDRIEPGKEFFLCLVG